MPALVKHRATHLQVVDDAALAPALTSAQERKAQALVTVMRYVRGLRGARGSDSLAPAVAEFKKNHGVGLLPTAVLASLDVLRPTKKGQCPNKATLYRWDQKYTLHLQGIATAAAPKHQGSRRIDYGWEARAIHLFNQPTKPHMSTVAYWLRNEGNTSATDSRVRSFLKSLPATLGAKSPKRMGRHYYDQNQRPYMLRDEGVLPVGFIYQGDGHTCDVYVQHPNTGKAWRPEFTVWVDVRSHFVVGWYLSECESGINTLFSLSHALVGHNHVPASVHVDVGSGFKNRMIGDETTGYLSRLSINFMTALPRNAKGKGLIEGSFHHFEERCGKQFATFCGHDRTDDYLRHLSQKVKRGQIVLPTLAEYRDAVADYINTYNTTPQKRLGCAPSDLWAQLDAVPLELTQAAIIRPQEKRKVQRWGVKLFNRLYRHPDLAQFNDCWVAVEYDLHNDNTVVIRDADGRFICEASQVDRKAWLEASRIEELQRKRVEGQIKRHQRHIDEQVARGRHAITHEDTLADLQQLTGNTLLTQDDTAETSSDIDLDIFDTDY